MAEAEVSETTQGLSLVCPSDIAFCNSGDDVVLSCRLDPAISAVSMEIKWKNKDDIVCHYKDGQVIESREGRVSLSVDDLHSGNVSLTLRDVSRSQRGIYTCEVIHRMQTLKEYIFLHISSEDFDLVVPTDPVIADSGDVVLPVHLSPETSAVCMDISWFRGTDLIYKYRNGLEEKHSAYESRVSLSVLELERGTLSLTLRNVEQSDSGEYTCRVFHDGHLQRGKVHLQVTVQEEFNRLLDESIQSHKQLEDRLRHLRYSFYSSTEDRKFNWLLEKSMDTVRQLEERLRDLRFNPDSMTEAKEEFDRLLKESIDSHEEFKDQLRDLRYPSHSVTEDFYRRLEKSMKSHRQLVERLRHSRFYTHLRTEEKEDFNRLLRELIESHSRLELHTYVSNPLMKGYTISRSSYGERSKPKTLELEGSGQLISMKHLQLRRRNSFDAVRPDLKGQSTGQETGQTTEAAGQSSTTDEAQKISQQ